MKTLTYYDTTVTKTLNLSLNNSGDYSLTDIAGNIIIELKCKRKFT